jgi:hypothetical protein
MTKLKKQHKRTVSTGLYIIEKSIDDLLYLITNEIDSSTYKIISDKYKKNNPELKEILYKIKKQLSLISGKYFLSGKEINLSDLINAKKNTLEIYAEELLPDYLEMKYGKMDIDVEEFGNEIIKLINTIKQI